VLSINPVHYIKRAAYARATEVERYIKDNRLYKILVIVIAPRRAQAGKSSSVKLRAQRDFAEWNKSKEGLVVNNIQPIQASEGAENYSVALT
jgi:hypothetical protein